MDRHEILAIANDWSFWEAEPPQTVPRLVALPTEFADRLPLIVQGVRRCGKSTLLQQLISRYGLDRSQCVFINFEDPRLASTLDHSVLDLLVEAFEAARGPQAVYFLDEIQWVKGWQRWLRLQVDRPKGRRFVVTGSNAHLLGGKVGSTLTGRHQLIELFPYDYSEFCLSRPNASLEDYLTLGGFPAVTNSADADAVLRTYFNDIVERDVRERVGARSVDPLRRVARMVFDTAGAELSARRIAAPLGIAPDTVGLYLHALEDAYLVGSCSYFTWSERKRASRNRKYYPVDTALRRVTSPSGSEDLGKNLEIATYSLLRRKFRNVYYWRGTGEVDFVIEFNRRPIPIQVSWNEPTERHLKAVDEFCSVHRESRDPIYVTRESFAQGVPELSHYA